MSTKPPADELAQFLDDAADEMIPEPPESYTDPEEREGVHHFRIDNADQLSWATRKYANADRLANEARTAAKAQVDQIRKWEAKVVAEQEGRMRFFEFLCADYLLRRQKEDKKLKGLPTPYGRVQSRKQQLAWKIGDKRALLAAIKTHLQGQLLDELVKVEEEPVLSAIKDAAKAGTHLQLTETGKDPFTEKAIYKVQLRMVGEGGEITWVDLPDMVVAEQPDKVTVEVTGK